MANFRDAFREDALLARMLDFCRDVPGLPILVCKRWLRCLPPDKCCVGTSTHIGRLSDALESQSMREAEVAGASSLQHWDEVLSCAPDWPHLEWLTLRSMRLDSPFPPSIGTRLRALDLHSVRLESAEATHAAFAAATSLEYLGCCVDHQRDVPAVEAIAACQALRRLDVTIENQDSMGDEGLLASAELYRWAPLLTLTQLTSLSFTPRNGCILTEPASVRTGNPSALCASVAIETHSSEHGLLHAPCVHAPTRGCPGPFADCLSRAQHFLTVYANCLQIVNCTAAGDEHQAA